MLFKNYYKNLLNEAEGDEGADEVPVEEEAPANEEIEEVEEEEEPEEDDNTEDNDNMDEESSEEEPTEEEKPKLAPNEIHAKQIYFERLEKLKNILDKFHTTMEDQSIHYKNPDETEEKNRKAISYIKEELSNTQSQIDTLLVDGVLINLDIKVIQTIYAKLKTKIKICMEMYSKVLNIKL